MFSDFHDTNDPETSVAVGEHTGLAALQTDIAAPNPVSSQPVEPLSQPSAILSHRYNTRSKTFQGKMDVEKLISLVENRPNLYDNRLASYHDRDLRENVWATIAAEMNCTEKECMKKWKHLRDQFMAKKKKRHGESKSGSAATKRKRWIHWERMLFLLPSVGFKETTSNFEGTCVGGDDESNCSILEPPPMPRPQEPSIDKNLDSFQTTPLNRMATRKRKSPSDALEDAIVNCMDTYQASVKNTATIKDPDELFVNSLVPMMKQLPNAERELLKLRMHRMVYETVFSVPNYQSASSGSWDPQRASEKETGLSLLSYPPYSQSPYS